MIGTQSGVNNDVYLYFEGDELDEVGDGPIVGTFVSMQDEVRNGTLTVTLDGHKCSRIRFKTDIDFNPVDGGDVINVGVRMDSDDYMLLNQVGYLESEFLSGRVFYRDVRRLPYSDWHVFLELARHRRH